MIVCKTGFAIWSASKYIKILFLVISNGLLCVRFKALLQLFQTGGLPWWFSRSMSESKTQGQKSQIHLTCNELFEIYKLFLYKFITTTTPPGKSRDKTAKLFFSPVFEVRKKEKPAQSSKRQQSRSCRSRFPQAIMALYLLEGEEQNRHQVSLRLLVLNSYMYFKRSCEFYLVIGIPAQDRCKMPMGFLPV